MALVNWTDNYSVDIKEIDAQHKKLVAMINTLHEAMSTGKGKDTVVPILDNLLAYTRTHFNNEEQLFTRHAYPARDQHTRIHNSLAQQVIDLKSKMNAGANILPVEVMEFMRDWLTSHIMAEDKKYAPFLKSKGVQ